MPIVLNLQIITILPSTSLVKMSGKVASAHAVMPSRYIMKPFDRPDVILVGSRGQ